jgi:hypothetical protein
MRAVAEDQYLLAVEADGWPFAPLMKDDISSPIDLSDTITKPTPAMTGG